MFYTPSAEQEPLLAQTESNAPSPVATARDLCCSGRSRKMSAARGEQKRRSESSPVRGDGTGALCRSEMGNGVISF